MFQWRGPPSCRFALSPTLQLGVLGHPLSQMVRSRRWVAPLSCSSRELPALGVPAPDPWLIHYWAPSRSAPTDLVCFARLSPVLSFMVLPTVVLLRTPTIATPLLLPALLLSSHPRASLVPSLLTCSSSVPFLLQLCRYVADGRPLLVSPSVTSPALSLTAADPPAPRDCPSSPDDPVPRRWSPCSFPPQMLQSAARPVSFSAISCVLMPPRLLPLAASSFPGWASPGQHSVVAPLLHGSHTCRILLRLRPMMRSLSSWSACPAWSPASTVCGNDQSG